MSAQVIFLPPHYITREEEIRRMELQHHLVSARAGLENRITNYPTYWKVVEREKHFSQIRSHIKLVTIEDTFGVDSQQGMH